MSTEVQCPRLLEVLSLHSTYVSLPWRYPHTHLFVLMLRLRSKISLRSNVWPTVPTAAIRSIALNSELSGGCALFIPV